METGARLKLPVGAASAVALAFAVSACSACVGSGCTTSASDVAKEARQEIDKAVQARGLPALPPVTCPHDIKNQVGAKMTCFAKGSFGSGHTGVLPINVTVTGVSGSTVKLHFDTAASGVQPLPSS